MGLTWANECVDIVPFVLSKLGMPTSLYLGNVYIYFLTSVFLKCLYQIIQKKIHKVINKRLEIDLLDLCEYTSILRWNNFLIRSVVYPRRLTDVQIIQVWTFNASISLFMGDLACLSAPSLSQIRKKQVLNKNITKWITKFFLLWKKTVVIFN